MYKDKKELIRQIIYDTYNYNFFDPRGWTFYTEELFPAIREYSWIFCNLIDYRFAKFDYIFKNYYSTGLHIMNFEELVQLSSNNQNNLVFMFVYNFTKYYFDHWYDIYFVNGTFTSRLSVEIYSMIFFSTNLSLYFIILLFLLFIMKWNYDFTQVSYIYRSDVFLYYQFIFYDFLTLVLNKYESSEEAICLVVLWPWCILLVFTHSFSYDNNEILFIFVEWGMPIVYGFFLLFEHLWNFGSYFFIYLNGGRGRRSFIIVIIEDILTFIIIIIRVSLQTVRGLLCGFFHNFFRGIYDNVYELFYVYQHYSEWNMPVQTSNAIIDLTLFFTYWYLIALTMLFVYAILFLQLLFLVIAVWLFCRCWFISSGNNVDVDTCYFDYTWNHKYNKINNKRDLNLKNNTNY